MNIPDRNEPVFVADEYEKHIGEHVDIPACFHAGLDEIVKLDKKLLDKYLEIIERIYRVK